MWRDENDSVSRFTAAIRGAVAGDALAEHLSRADRAQWRGDQRLDALRSACFDGTVRLGSGRYALRMLEGVAEPLPSWTDMPPCFYTQCGCMVEPHGAGRPVTSGAAALADGIALARAFGSVACGDDGLDDALENRRSYARKVLGTDATPRAADAGGVLAEILGDVIASGDSWMLRRDWEPRAVVAALGPMSLGELPAWLLRSMARFDGLHGLGPRHRRYGLEHSAGEVPTGAGPVHGAGPR